MSDDPFAPPSAPVRDRLPEPAGSAWKAVTFGVLADFMATIIGSMVLFSLLGAALVSQGASPEDLDDHLMGSDMNLMILMGWGVTCTVFGGYVTARVAKRREYYHALLTGIVVLVLGEMLLSASPEGYSLAARLISDILAIPAALFGAHLCKARNARLDA
jgi:hypothetical protein